MGFMGFLMKKQDWFFLCVTVSLSCHYLLFLVYKALFQELVYYYSVTHNVASANINDITILNYNSTNCDEQFKAIYEESKNDRIEYRKETTKNYKKSESNV